MLKVLLTVVLPKVKTVLPEEGQQSGPIHTFVRLRNLPEGKQSLKILE